MFRKRDESAADNQQAVNQNTNSVAGSANSGNTDNDFSYSTGSFPVFRTFTKPEEQQAQAASNQNAQSTQSVQPQLEEQKPVANNNIIQPVQTSQPNITESVNTPAPAQSFRARIANDTPALNKVERTLNVDNGVSIQGGRISNCDRLVVNGTVEADLGDVKALDIGESGVVNCEATVESADISGTYKGDITVKGLMVINSTGVVKGRINVGSIEIKPGGKLIGEIVEDAPFNNTFSKPQAVNNIKPQQQQVTKKPELAPAPPVSAPAPRPQANTITANNNFNNIGLSNDTPVNLNLTRPQQITQPTNNQANNIFASGAGNFTISDIRANKPSFEGA